MSVGATVQTNIQTKKTLKWCLNNKKLKTKYYGIILDLTSYNFIFSYILINISSFSC